MDEWTSLSAKRHQQFEIDWKAKDHHKLNLSDVIIKDSDMTLLNSQKEMSSISSNNDIVKQIKDLKMIDALQFNEEHGEVCPAGWNRGDDGMMFTSTYKFHLSF